MTSKTILVTGCSAGGIGAAIASALAAKNHHVFATARDPSKIPESLSALSNVSVLRLDVCEPASIREAVQTVADAGTELDVLVNNAGGGYAMPLLDVDIDKAKQLYDVNVWGPLRAVQAFSKLLIARRGRPLPPERPVRPPPGSLYAPIEKIIAGWASGESKPKGVPAEKFALTIVDDIVGEGKAGLVWRGPNAGSIKYLAQFAPQSVNDAAMSYTQGLKELKAHHDGNSKA
ncbi:hypothetical protein PG988_003733 [Apiospora saccharicola]